MGKGLERRLNDGMRIDANQFTPMQLHLAVVYQG
jgi:hypothetical protein